jgi:hypothetical protein
MDEELPRNFSVLERELERHLHKKFSPILIEGIVPAGLQGVMEVEMRLWRKSQPMAPDIDGFNCVLHMDTPPNPDGSSIRFEATAVLTGGRSHTLLGLGWEDDPLEFP